MPDKSMRDERFDRYKLHVVKILNARELVISGGREAELELDMILRVLGSDTKLIDPVTGESLGDLVATKVLVRIYDVADKYALARTFRTRTKNVGGDYEVARVSALFKPPKYETYTETLERDESYDLRGESAVAPGDPVEVWAGAIDDVPSVTVWN